MSKRFGRNQRRKMREEIAAQKYLVDVHKERAQVAINHRDDLSVRWRHFYKSIEHTQQVLGRYFITLPPSTIEHDEIPAHWVTEAPEKSIAMMPSLDPAAVWADVAEKLSYIEYAILKGSTAFDDLRSQMHIRFESRHGDVAYALGQNSLKGLTREQAAYRIAQSMAEFLVRDQKFKQFTGLKL